MLNLTLLSFFSPADSCEIFWDGVRSEVLLQGQPCEWGPELDPRADPILKPKKPGSRAVLQDVGCTRL